MKGVVLLNAIRAGSDVSDTIGIDLESICSFGVKDKKMDARLRAGGRGEGGGNSC